MRAKTAISVSISNACDADIKLTKTGGPGPAEIVLPARAVSLVRLTVPDGTKNYELSYTASNWLIAREGPAGEVEDRRVGRGNSSPDASPAATLPSV